ncbi:hypothetical protein QIH53_27710, partial [Klebsiella pneumoniae]|nr:hypothetical protein [Klebsiella pneumoniae]
LCVARARDWTAEVARALNPQLGKLPDIESIMREALREGDDCHAITRAGNDRLLELRSELPTGIVADIRA